MRWTKVALDKTFGDIAWVGDRFVMVDEAGAVRTSIDGANWHVLQRGDPDPGYAELLGGPAGELGDNIVGWWNPRNGPDLQSAPVTARDILRIVRPPAAPTDTTPFKGRIESIGHRARRDRGPGPLPPRLGRLGRLQAG